MGILAVLQGTAEWEVVTVPPWLHNLPVQIALWNQHACQRGNNISSDSTISKKWIEKRLCFNVWQKKRKVNWKSPAGIKWESNFLLIVIKNVIIRLHKMYLPIWYVQWKSSYFSQTKIILNTFMLHFTFTQNALFQGQNIQFTCI